MGGSSARARQPAWSVAPFAGAALVAWAAMPVGTAIAWREYAVSAVLALLAWMLALYAMRGRHWVVPAALMFFAAAALLRDCAGGMSSGAAALAVIPVFATALYSRSRRDLVCVLVGLALFYLVPIVVEGAPGYPATQYRAGLLALTVSAIIGATTQQLVGRVRAEAAQARDRGRMLERVSEAVYGLWDSSSARADVCEAARDIGEATVALIYEPVGEQLVCTTVVGLDVGDRRVVAAPQSVLAEAFDLGRPRLIDSDVRGQVGSVELWTRAGCPASVLYQPLRRGAATVGVLAVGWPHQVRADGPRCTVIALLAHEAAAIIARADALHTLADEAQTDPLTGLPNRRAWDAALARGLAARQPLAVAMLDIDHFKRFNDAFGHPAGDRLLERTAAAWRQQLRGGDLLARLGGEEFGLLLVDCEPSTAFEVVQRLRADIPEDQTCSAGIATRGGDEHETAGQLVARADAALYEAKAAGRDRAQLSAARPAWAAS